MDPLSTEEFEKHVRRTRNTLFVVAGLLLLAIIQVLKAQDNSFKIGLVTFFILMSAIYIGLGFWARKRPYSALIAAICVYIGSILLYEMIAPGSLSRNIIIRIAVILVLVSGLSNARKCQRMIEASENLQ
jgi:hypothetical membrane protein